VKKHQVTADNFVGEDDKKKKHNRLGIQTVQQHEERNYRKLKILLYQYTN